MALSTVLRLTSTSFLFRPRLFLSPSSSSPLTLRHLRFLSSTSYKRTSHEIRTSKPKNRGEVHGIGEEQAWNGGPGDLLVVEDNGRIVPKELHKEATKAYMTYAMSVLLGRALPDVR